MKPIPGRLLPGWLLAVTLLFSMPGTTLMITREDGPAAAATAAAAGLEHKPGYDAIAAEQGAPARHCSLQA